MSQHRRRSYTTPELNEEAWLNHIFHAYGVRLGSGQLYVDGRNRYVYAASEYVAHLGRDGEPQNATDWAESIAHRPRHLKTTEVAQRSNCLRCAEGGPGAHSIDCGERFERFEIGSRVRTTTDGAVGTVAARVNLYGKFSVRVAWDEPRYGQDMSRVGIGVLELLQC